MIGIPEMIPELSDAYKLFVEKRKEGFKGGTPQDPRRSYRRSFGKGKTCDLSLLLRKSEAFGYFKGSGRKRSESITDKYAGYWQAQI